MFNWTPEQIMAALITLALFAGGLTGAAVLYYIQCRSERLATVKHRKPKMDKNADLEHVEQALNYSYIPVSR